jgi:hypothetical protein
MGLVELAHVERESEPQEVVTADISKPEIKVKAKEPEVKVDLAELITKKVMEALKEAGVV